MSAMISDGRELTPHYTTMVDTLCELAGSYYARGRSGDARHLFRSALLLSEEGGIEELTRFKLLLQYGRTLAQEYVYTNAERELMFSIILEAKRIAERTGDRQRMADALNVLGLARYFAELNAAASADSPDETYGEALDCYRQALEIREALHDTRGMSESYFHMGTVYERRQRIDRALECYTKAVRIAEEFGHRDEKTEPARHFAFHALSRGDLDRALEYGMEALSLREEVGFMPYLPLDHLLLSDIYLRKGDAENALKHTERAFVLAEEMGYKRALASALLSLGDIHAARKEEERAKAEYEQALACAQELQIPLVTARVRERLERLAAKS